MSFIVVLVAFLVPFFLVYLRAYRGRALPESTKAVNSIFLMSIQSCKCSHVGALCYFKGALGYFKGSP